MAEPNGDDKTLNAERVVAFSPDEVYAAFEQPEKLARWWGPKGFTNTFELFEFEVDGRWKFVMHGPESGHYPNDSVFLELVPGEKIVIDHVSPPHFELTITLTPRDGGTHVAWVQEFESAEVAATIRERVGAANDENLDRLEAVLAGEAPS